MNAHGESWDSDARTVQDCQVWKTADQLKALLSKDSFIQRRDNQELHKINLLNITVSEVSRCKTTTSIV